MSQQVKDMIEQLKQDSSIRNIEETERYATIEYSAKQNKEHIFHSRVFPNDSIKARLIGAGNNYDVTGIGYDKCIDVGRNQKIITYRASDIGTTNNVHRVESIVETLGHPFRRKVSYTMQPDGKDKLQTKINCVETYHIDSTGNRVRPLDNIFVTRVFRLYLRFQGYTMNDIRHIIDTQETLSGFDIMEMLDYLYTAIKSYNKFFYKHNGLSLYNIEWLFHIKRLVKHKSLLAYDYELVKVSRGKQIDSREIDQDEYKQWLIDRQRYLKTGRYDHIMLRSGVSNHRFDDQIEQAQKRIEEIKSIHKDS